MKINHVCWASAQIYYHHNDYNRINHFVTFLLLPSRTLMNDNVNAYATLFFLQRAVVAQLRETYLQTNEEIKSANRVKEAIEKALEHKR